MYMEYKEQGVTELSIQEAMKDKEEAYSFMGKDLCIPDENFVNQLKGSPSFNAEAIFVSNESKGLTVYSDKCFKKLYPASLTKLMTAYVTLKYADNLEERAVVTAESKKIGVPFAKLMGLMENDSITLRTLLNATLVHSSNDAAKVLAFQVAGSEEEFVKLMNKEALSLGAVDTHFTNPHGLHDPSNYTTLYDIYLIFHELLKDERFLSIIGQKSYEAKYQNGLGGAVIKKLNSTNGYLLGTYTAPKQFVIHGGKTGTTDEAGNCMIIYSSSPSGEKYIAGIMKATDQVNLYAGFSSIFENIP